MSNKISKVLEDRTVAIVLNELKENSNMKELVEKEQDYYREEVLKRIPEEFKEMYKGKPESWFKKISEFCIYGDTAIRVLGYSSRVPFKEAVIVPNDFDSSIGSYSNKVVSPFYRKAMEYKDELIRAETKIRVCFNSCTTINRLFTLYPELKPYILDEGVQDGKDVDLSFLKKGVKK